MKNFLNKIISIRLLTYILLGALALSLLLLLRLGLYSVPWYDDFGYTGYTKSFQDVYGYGPVNALKGVFFQVHETWYSWQGTYSSVFFMALCPIVWGEGLYWIGPFFLILMLTVSEIVFGYTVAGRIFKMRRDASFCMGLSMAILSVWRIHNACQGFYWYNAGVHYVGMHSFMLFLLSVLVCLSEKKKASATGLKIAASMVLALLCSGANYVTALQGFLAVVVVTCFAVFVRKRNVLFFLPSLAVYIVGFAFNAMAPGNAKRAAFFVGSSNSAVTAVLKSFVKAFGHLWEFTGIFTIVFLIMAAPIIWKGLENSEFKFRLPGAFVALAFCFYATSYTPTLYAIGDDELGRVLNAAKLTYQIMLVLSEIYVIGWLRNKLKEPREAVGFVWLYVLCAVVLGVSFAVNPMERIQYSPYGAYYYVHTGEAAAYHNGFMNMVADIKSQGADVLVDRNVFKPSYLYAGELSEDPTYEPNVFIARWYGKNSIAVKED